MQKYTNKVSVTLATIADKYDGVYSFALGVSEMKTNIHYKHIIIVKNPPSALKIDMPHVKLLPFIYHGGKKVTIAEQRNQAICASKSDVIVFLDLDSKPSNYWLDNLIHSYLQNHSIVAGPIVTCGDTRNSIQAKRINHAFLSEAPTANLLIKKDLFDIVGLFDTNFYYGSDTDWSWRATKLGYKIFLNPNAIISHKRDTLKQEIKRSFRYGSARARLYQKHWYRREKILTEDIMGLFYATYIIIFPLFLIFPILLIPIPLLMIKNYDSNPIKTILSNFSFGAGIIRYVFIKE